STGARRRRPALSTAQDLEDHAGDRSRRDGDVPGHPGAGARARSEQARRVSEPRHERVRHEGEVMERPPGTADSAGFPPHSRGRAGDGEAASPAQAPSPSSSSAGGGGSRPPKVELRNVGLRYFGREGETEALRDISLAIAPGEFVAIIGQSGCGKSTL